MNKEIASILKGRLLANGGLPFVDSISGLAQRVVTKEPTGEGTTTTKAMPVSYDNSPAQGCSISKEKALIPDSSRRGLLYFEDRGAAIGDGVGGGIGFTSGLTLVCWMNRERLVDDSYTELSAYCVAKILHKLNTHKYATEGMFQRFMVRPGRVLPQDAGVFARYTYDETVTQYLRPPFEFFALELSVDYVLHPNCIDTITFKEVPPCF